MYIPEFWCGVVATVLCEVAVCIGIAVIEALRSGGKDETTKEVD